MENLEQIVKELSIKYQVPSHGTCWILAEKLIDDNWKEIKGSTLSGGLQVKTLTGKTIEVDFISGQTVESLKDEIYSIEGIPPDQ